VDRDDKRAQIVNMSREELVKVYIDGFPIDEIYSVAQEHIIASPDIWPIEDIRETLIDWL
jgi:hypothetical protein